MKEEKCCEKSVESLSEAITYKFGHIQEMVQENTEYIANIHAKLDPILFPKSPEKSSEGKCGDNPSLDNIWQYFDETVYILGKQRSEIMALYERLEG